MRIYRQLRRDWARRQADRPGFTRADLHTLAGRETWRETFVLLFEALSDPDSPMDPADLAAHIFDPRAAMLGGAATVDWLDRPQEATLEPISPSSSASGTTASRAILLAALLADTRVDLSVAIRDALLPALIETYKLEFSKDTYLGGHVVRFLLTQPRLREQTLRLLPQIAITRKWTSLDLYGCGITDLGPFARLTSLRGLQLFGNPIADFRPLNRLNYLQCLGLSETGIADLAPLHGLKKLSLLFIDGTPAAKNDSQINALQKALPNLKIQRGPAAQGPPQHNRQATPRKKRTKGT